LFIDLGRVRLGRIGRVWPAAGGPAGEPALGDAGYVGAGELMCLAGEMTRIPAGHGIGGGAVGEHAEHHGDRDDGSGVIGGRAAQFLQG
jgi:hypothetical protein